MNRVTSKNSLRTALHDDWHRLLMHMVHVEPLIAHCAEIEHDMLHGGNGEL